VGAKGGSGSGGGKGSGGKSGGPIRDDERESPFRHIPGKVEPPRRD